MVGEFLYMSKATSAVKEARMKHVTMKRTIHEQERRIEELETQLAMTKSELALQKLQSLVNVPLFKDSARVPTDVDARSDDTSTKKETDDEASQASSLCNHGAGVCRTETERFQDSFKLGARNQSATSWKPDEKQIQARGVGGVYNTRPLCSGLYTYTLAIEAASGSTGSESNKAGLIGFVSNQQEKDALFKSCQGESLINLLPGMIEYLAPEQSDFELSLHIDMMHRRAELFVNSNGSKGHTTAAHQESAHTWTNLPECVWLAVAYRKEDAMGRKVKLLHSTHWEISP